MEEYLGVRNSNSNSMSIVPVVTTRSMTKITFAVLMYEKDTNKLMAVVSVGFDYVAHIKRWNMSFCIFPDKARFSPFKEEVRRSCEDVISKLQE